MAQINACLKRTFTFFNLLFAILGGVIIALALLTQTLTSNNGGQDFDGRMVGLIMLYILGAVTMVIALLGAYGAMKENKVALIVFLVCMVLGTLFMWRAGVTTAISRPQIGNMFEEKMRHLIPLDRSPESTQTQISIMQAKLQCCGLFSYEDWGRNIPSSCECSSEQQMEGKCQTVQYPNLHFHEQAIFRETCFPIFMGYVDLVANISLAILFSLATLAVLGLVLSSIMIHQMRVRVDRPTMILSIPAVVSLPPPKYEELHNYPEY